MTENVKVGGYAIEYGGSLVHQCETTEECRKYCTDVLGLSDVGRQVAAQRGELEFHKVSEKLYEMFEREGFDVEYADDANGVLVHATEVL